MRSRNLTLATVSLTMVAALGVPEGAAGTLRREWARGRRVVFDATPAPTGLAAVRAACAVLTSSAVDLSWTATSSTFADGYQIFRSTNSGSGYASIGTVSGRATTTFTSSTVAFLTTYYYVVQAKKLAWRSANSNQAQVTTPNQLCV